jgi:hypothetical protein
LLKTLSAPSLSVFSWAAQIPNSHGSDKNSLIWLLKTGRQFRVRIAPSKTRTYHPGCVVTLPERTLVLKAASRFVSIANPRFAGWGMSGSKASAAPYTEKGAHKGAWNAAFAG